VYYCIIGEDIENSLEKRLSVRSAHLERLQQLQNQGRLLVAGPNPAIDNDDPGPNGFSGSVIIAEFDSIKDALQWADDDPYIAAGVYRHVTVKPFKKVLP